MEIVHALKAIKRSLVLSFFLLLFGIGGLFFVFDFKPSSIDIAKTLNTIPEDDREALEGFFRSLNEATCSYVLFGNKPMSICSFLEIEPQHSKIFRFEDFMGLSFDLVSTTQLRAYRGWLAWKKYSHLFPSSNYSILENREPGWITIIMINKRAFLKTIEENIDDFKQVLGVHITPQKILDNCLKANDIFKDVLASHHGLYGILLGYGRHNAQLFNRLAQIEGTRSRDQFSLTKKSLSPSEGFSTIDEEYHYLKETLLPFDEFQGDNFNPLFMLLPAFMADHTHPETQELKFEYRQQYKNIIGRYKEGDFLKITLNQFVSVFKISISKESNELGGNR